LHGATTRNAVPEIFWQSVQWQIRTRSGSISASNAIAPQWHEPSTFMM
jgi:hypothetical protein